VKNVATPLISQLKTESCAKLDSGAPTAVSTILVVDRDLGFVILLSQTLMAAGYQVVPACDFQGGVNLLRKLKLNVDMAVVEDVLLPELGSSVLSALSPLPVPILLTSDSPLTMGREEAAGRGVTAALRKPKLAHRLPADRWLTRVREVMQNKTPPKSRPKNGLSTRSAARRGTDSSLYRSGKRRRAAR